MQQPWLSRTMARLKFWGGQKSITEIQSMLLRNTASWSARNFVAFATEGFQQNATVRACVGAIQEAAKTCPVVIINPDGSIIREHPLLDLLKRPNPEQSYGDFLDAAIGDRLIAGEGDVYGVAGGTKFNELWILRPDWLEPQIVSGMLVNWRYTPVSADTYVQATTISPHELYAWKTFNPFDCYRGFSPLWSCAFAIDTLNQYARANKALLDNDARPSGLLSTKTELSDKSFARLKKESRAEYAGTENTAKLMVVDGGLEYKPMGLSPREMEFINGKITNEQDVCKVLRVPGQMIGLPGTQTFANYEQARASFYEDTVIPMVNSLLLGITHWAGRQFNLKPGQRLAVDVEHVAALEPRRVERNKTIDAMNSLSVNEKRNAMNYEDVDNGEVILVDSSKIPLDLAGSDILTTDPVSAANNAGIKPNKPVPAPAPSKPDNKPIAAGTDVQAQALNGAQMASLQSIVQAVVDDAMPAEAAINLIMLSIPSITREQATALIKPAEDFEAPKKPEPPANPPPNQPVPPKAEPDLTPTGDDQ